MISGSVVALVTPMHSDGSIDWQALSRLIEWHIEQGTDGIVAVGTTGESATLAMDEHKMVIKACVDQVAGRIKVVAGTGANSTAEAIELTKVAREVGADACLLVTPYYNKPTQEGLYRHYMAIADAVDIPQILYNVPGRTACDMLNSTTIRLAEHRNIIAIKDATGDLARGKELIDAVGDKLDVLSGDDATAAELMLLGGKGNISVTANIAPAAVKAVCLAAMSGDKEATAAADAPLRILHDRLFVEANPIPVKWALLAMGMMEDGIRLPLTVLSEAAQPSVTEALTQAGLLD
ncbi:MAG: 4-hydroxy-tetrahydrodipicolinate synthase [Zhongshania marina]|jgi:4-hydroxy-tetrahydrodipicolinate synthase|uniref:4-hydroxy-tetrahydrodipicolinate synthase n=1 Tax=Zhongshania marina TaxID=2304603 RepID=A0A2S4HFX5_9GAMM|nr:4-hydroxy-tetrahydrodipicolinate synthase [Marortus luteolus]POP52893.1 4-hydroxy-tetrahydrodipicolinate synthase [Marortus luteolus]RNL60340.1 4-hydroxy-tetrahydrodipicolinate synthase [Zhongshania marina]